MADDEFKTSYSLYEAGDAYCIDTIVLAPLKLRQFTQVLFVFLIDYLDSDLCIELDMHTIS